MRHNVILILMLTIVLSLNAQHYEVGTTSAIWKSPTANDFIEAKSFGVENIEIALNQCYRGVSKEEVLPRIRRLKAAVDSADINVWSIHLPFSRTLDISILNDSLRNANVLFLKTMIEQCKQFNPTCLVLHPSSEPIPGDVREQRIKNAHSSIIELNAVADSLGMQLCIENLPRTCLGNTPEELLRIIHGIPGIKVCFDTNHYVLGSTSHFIDVVGNMIGTIHASDFDYVNECHWIPTQGDIKWNEFMSNLYKSGYRGVFMYEAVKDREEDNAKPKTKKIKVSFDEILNRNN